MIKIKIESDGTPEGTRVIDAVTGDPIGGVSSVSFVATIDGTEALVGFRGVECDIITYAAVDDWLAVEDEGWVEIKGRMPKVVDEDWVAGGLRVTPATSWNWKDGHGPEEWIASEAARKAQAELEKEDGGPTTD